MEPNERLSQLALTARVGVVISRYNARVTDQLLEGAQRILSSPSVVEAPGAFELPSLAGAMAASGAFDGVLALGCVIKGETDHDRYINHAVTEGLMSIAVASGVPVGFGVLTCSTIEQAIARARPESEGGGDKGGEAASALLATIDQIRRITSGAAKPGRVLELGFTPTDKAGSVR